MLDKNDSASDSVAPGSLRPEDVSKEHEMLARILEVGDRDNSYAMVYSPLLDDSRWGKRVLASRLYRRVYPLIFALAVYMMVKVTLYRVVVWPVLAPFWTKIERRKRWILGPKIGTIWFDAFDDLASVVRNGVTTSAALDATYSYAQMPPVPGIRGVMRSFWFNQPDAVGVCNRLQITYEQLVDRFEVLYRAGEPIRVLSLACGSAQAVVDACCKIRERHLDVDIRITLVDLSRGSLRRAVRYAQYRKVDSCIAAIRSDLNDFLVLSQAQGRCWNVVEMVGYLDYRRECELVSLCAAVRPVLGEGGVFITSHICPAQWSFALRWIVNWIGMRRRTPPLFQALLEQAGYQVVLLVEPNEIHAVAVCR